MRLSRLFRWGIKLIIFTISFNAICSESTSSSDWSVIAEQTANEAFSSANPHEELESQIYFPNRIETLNFHYVESFASNPCRAFALVREWTEARLLELLICLNLRSFIIIVKRKKALAPCEVGDKFIIFRACRRFLGICCNHFEHKSFDSFKYWWPTKQHRVVVFTVYCLAQFRG